MQLLFQNPAWWLAALAAIPLLAHLFSRARPRQHLFPSIRLLQEAMRRVNRIQRPRDRWLLILRTLAMAALALAFLQPWLAAQQVRDQKGARTAVLVVDVSASMGYADSTRTRLAQATAAAEEFLDALPSGSRANVVWIGAQATSALPEPGQNLDFLRQRLRHAIVRPEPGDIEGALALAIQQLERAEGARELLVVSDFQQATWRETRWEVPPSIELTRVSVGEVEGANVGLADLTCEPARPVAGRESRLVCRVRNFSGEPRRVTLFAEAGESRSSQPVEIAPWSETLAVVPVVFAQEGLVPLKVAVTEDRFPGDDVRYGLAEVRGALQVGIVAPLEDPTAKVWNRASAALDGVTVQQVAPESEAGLGPVDVLFLRAWQGVSPHRLRERLSRGTILVAAPVADASPEVIPEWLGLAAGTEATAFSRELRDAPGWALRIVREEHPVFRLFAGGAFGDPIAARFTERIRLPQLPAEAETLIAYDDDLPALAFQEVTTDNGKGLLWWWNLDLRATDWPSRSGFISFFGEFLNHLAQRAGRTLPPANAPGAPLRFEVAPSVDPADVQLINEKDAAQELAEQAPGAPHHLASAEALPPGSYRWMAQGAVLDRAVINFPETESDLRRIPPAELSGATGAVIAQGASASFRASREGRKLWPWCLAAAAAFLLIEGLILWRRPITFEQSPAAGKSGVTPPVAQDDRAAAA